MARFGTLSIYAPIPAPDGAEDTFDYANPTTHYSQVTKAFRPLIQPDGTVQQVDSQFRGVQLNDSMVDDVRSGKSALVYKGKQYIVQEVVRIRGKMYRISALAGIPFHIPRRYAFYWDNLPMYWGDYQMEWDTR